jgi:hypothetical protein
VDLLRTTRHETRWGRAQVRASGSADGVPTFGEWNERPNHAVIIRCVRDTAAADGWLQLTPSPYLAIGLTQFLRRFSRACKFPPALVHDSPGSETGHTSVTLIALSSGG